MEMQLSSILYLSVRIIFIAVILSPACLASPSYSAIAQTPDTNWVLQFDGTSDNVKLAKTSDIIGSGWKATKSVNLWVKPMKPPGDNDCDRPIPGSCDTILGDSPRSWGITVGRIILGPYAGQDRIWVWNVDDYFLAMDFIGIPYTLNEWVNIALVHEDGMLRAYKNGVLAASLPSGATVQSLGPDPWLYLGGTINGPTDIRTFGGQLDEVHIWDVALSAAEITDQMYHTTITDTLGLKAYYQMSDGAGIILTDDGQFNWDGAIRDGGGSGVPGDGDFAEWVEYEFLIPNPPAAPSILSAIAISFNQVELSWNDNSDNEYSFEIERCTGLGCDNYALLDTILDSPGTGMINYQDTNVSTGTTYCYRVRAANAGGGSDYTNSACATVPIPVFLPITVR